MHNVIVLMSTEQWNPSNSTQSICAQFWAPSEHNIDVRGSNMLFSHFQSSITTQLLNFFPRLVFLALHSAFWPNSAPDRQVWRDLWRVLWTSMSRENDLFIHRDCQVTLMPGSLSRMLNNKDERDVSIKNASWHQLQSFLSEMILILKFLKHKLFEPVDLSSIIILFYPINSCCVCIGSISGPPLERSLLCCGPNSAGK